MPLVYYSSALAKLELFMIRRGSLYCLCQIFQLMILMHFCLLSAKTSIYDLVMLCLLYSTVLIFYLFIFSLKLVLRV